MTDNDLLAAVKIDILNQVTIADLKELGKQDFETNEGKVYFLEFCHRVVEGGIIQFVIQPDLLVAVIEKVGDELLTHSQFIGDAVKTSYLLEIQRVANGL